MQLIQLMLCSFSHMKEKVPIQVRQYLFHHPLGFPNKMYSGLVIFFFFKFSKYIPFSASGLYQHHRMKYRNENRI